MNEQKHTPGPWRVATGGQGRQIRTIGTDITAETVIALSLGGRNNGEVHANARLIAKAKGEQP